MKIKLAATGYFADTLLQAGTGFVLVAVAARNSTLSEFGEFALIIAVAAIQQTLATLGSQQIIYSRSAKNGGKIPYLNTTAFGLTLRVSILFYLATTVLLVFFGNNVYLYLYLLGGLRVLSAASNPLLMDAQARHAIREFLPYRVFSTIPVMILCSILWATSASIEYFALLWGAEPLFFLAMMTLSAKSYKRLVPLKTTAKFPALAAKSYPLALQSVLVSIYYRYDQFYVQYQFGAEPLAIYSAAARIAEVGNIAFGVLTLLLAPRLIAELRLSSGIPRVVVRGIILILAMSVAVSISCFAIGEFILGFIFGQEFAAGSSVLGVYVLSTGLTLLGSLASKALVAHGSTNFHIVSGLVGVGVMIASSFYLCQYLGPIGAAWATVLAYAAAVFVLIMRLYYLRSILEVHRNYSV